ncbi:MAG: hypothetical protein E6713_11130 [Sporomusaceae bacterium]|nr:hypothetical protein [Sporomusaceae bacterium]
MSIQEELAAWTYPEKLPQNLLGFELSTLRETSGTQTILFNYDFPAKKRRFIAFYDEATKDFMVRVIIGLTEYNDVSYIVTDLAAFESLLQERMENTLHELAVFEEHHLESVLLQTKITTWEYGTKLPHAIGPFSLFISPQEPVKVINGSYIVLDYSCFSEESNFLLYYNIYRDEYFGEIRLHRTPEMIFDFDAKNLKELEEKLEIHLKDTLNNLEKRFKAAD